MKNETVNEALRKYVQTNLTPTPEERKLISAIYAAVCSVLGTNKCLQIGSYPRYTAIRPPHDLDVLFILGRWDKKEPKASNALSKLKSRLETELVPPQGFSFDVKLQTHSITIQFIRNGEEVFAVDIKLNKPEDFDKRYSDYYQNRTFNKVKFSDKDNSLVSFFLQLTRYLQQAIGTIPAIDLNAYSSAIGFEIDEEI